MGNTAKGLTDIAPDRPVKSDHPPADPSGTMVGQIRAQFGKRKFVSVSDVAAAVNVGSRTVLAWKEAGLIEGINVGSGKKPYFRISGPSVIKFLEKRNREH